jgi:hypothetical protein
MRILKFSDGNHYQCIVKSIGGAIVTNLYGSELPNVIRIKLLSPIEVKYAVSKGLAQP